MLKGSNQHWKQQEVPRSSYFNARPESEGHADRFTTSSETYQETHVSNFTVVLEPLFWKYEGSTIECADIISFKPPIPLVTQAENTNEACLTYLQAKGVVV